MTEPWEPSLGDGPIDFCIDLEPQGETVKLILAGELDIATVGRLQSELDDLIDGGFALIVIDLRGVEFIDSAALHALVTAHERAEHDDWQLAIVPGRHAVQRLFETTGTIEQLPFTPAASKFDPSITSSAPNRPYDVEPAYPA